jgi:hypothetical protein
MNLHSLYKIETKNIVAMFPDFRNRVLGAIALVDSVPGYHRVAARLRRLTIKYDDSLPDRAQTTLRFQIIVGPKSFSDYPTDDAGTIGLAATLVHEEFHTRQNPLLKTLSFWAGICTGTHPMARYEWPAYRAQTTFLRALAAVRPDLADDALREIDAIQSAVESYYGKPPQGL